MAGLTIQATVCCSHSDCEIHFVNGRNTVQWRRFYTAHMIMRWIMTLCLRAAVIGYSADWGTLEAFRYHKNTYCSPHLDISIYAYIAISIVMVTAAVTVG